jgi:hypothetical protein
MRNAAFKGRMTRSINDFQFGFATPFSPLDGLP